MSRPDLSHPGDFARAGYPVAAVFLAVVALGFGIAALVAQTSDPVRVDDVGSFTVPAEADSRALYVASDSLDLMGEPPCLVRGRVLEAGEVIALPRTVAGERTRVAARLGPTEPGDRVTCPTLAGEPGWLVTPSGTRWLYTGMALVLLVVLTLVRVVAWAVLGRPGEGAGPQGAAR